MEEFSMKISKFVKAALIIGGVVSALSFTSAFASTSASNFKIDSVKVVDAKTVKVTFNNPLTNENTDACARHFYGDHLDANTPHNHEVSAITLSDDQKTVTLNLSRALHTDDRVDLIVLNVKDIYGNVLNDIDWEIWANGAKK
jgi:hypothetical protein